MTKKIKKYKPVKFGDEQFAIEDKLNEIIKQLNYLTKIVDLNSHSHSLRHES